MYHAYNVIKTLRIKLTNIVMQGIISNDVASFPKYNHEGIILDNETSYLRQR